jgi:hypothetical protein
VVLEKVLLLVEGTGCATGLRCSLTSGSRLTPCGTNSRTLSVCACVPGKIFSFCRKKLGRVKVVWWCKMGSMDVRTR